jgi:hypothetical protein
MKAADRPGGSGDAALSELGIAPNQVCNARRF